VLVGTTLEAVCFLFEIPTGVVADLYSRRLSVVVGLVLVGSGFAIEGLFPYFGAILFSQLVWGIGATFMSGAEDAWIADEVGEERVGPVFLRGSQVAQIGTFAAIPVSVAFASVHLSYPIVLGGCLLMLLGLFLALAMPETGFHPAPAEQRSSWRSMVGTTRQGIAAIRGRPLLLTLVAVIPFLGMSSEGRDRLSAAHFLADFDFPRMGDLQPVVWFGIMSAGAALLSIGATELVRRRIDTTDQAAVVRLVFAIDALRIVSLVAFGLAGSFAAALAANWSYSVLRTLREPVWKAWINQHVDPRVRATVLSMAGQADAVGQIVGGPVVGAIGTLVSLRAAMVAAGVALSPVLLLYARVSRQHTAVEPVLAVD
jgi:DHA3 family tetracycline resistance protein-like MFS transporter